MAGDGDAASDEWKDERNDDRIAEGAAAGESSGVDSEAGGFVMAVLASRLHTGQNVLQEVSHASTQKAWNSVHATMKRTSEHKTMPSKYKKGKRWHWC